MRSTAKKSGSSAGSLGSPSQRERSKAGDSPILEGGGGSIRLATTALLALITRWAASRNGRERIEACDETTTPAPLERSAPSLEGAPPIEKPAASNMSASALACGSSSRTQTMSTSAMTSPAPRASHHRDRDTTEQKSCHPATRGNTVNSRQSTGSKAPVAVFNSSSPPSATP